MRGLCFCGLCKCSSVGSSILRCPAPFWDQVWTSVPNFKQHNTVLFMKYLQSEKFPFEIYQKFLYQAVWRVWAIIVRLKLEAVECTCEGYKEILKVYGRNHYFIHFVHVVLTDDKIVTFWWEGDKISPCTQVKNTQLSGQAMITIRWPKNSLVKLF